jgi:uncharacterized repeat protein (TIGR01451 family)
VNSDNYLIRCNKSFPSQLLMLSFVCLIALGISPAALGATPGGAGQADLTIAKSGDEAVPRGGNITYSIVVTNGGPDTAANVTVTDPLPAHTTHVNSSVSQGSVNFDGVNVVASCGSLAFGDSAILTLIVSVNTDTPRNTVISNTATVTSDTPDPSPADNSATALTAVTGAFPGDLLISEFRLRGPGTGGAGVGVKPTGNNTGAFDEFIEIYNNTDASQTVTSIDKSSGYAVVASDNVLRCTIPNGTVIPAGGHFLCVNSIGYSLSSYPASRTTTATGDASYTTDIPDNAGIALFLSTANFSLGNRLDAVGSTSEANTLYKEGTGYPALTPFSIDYSFYRDTCGLQGAVASLAPCTISGGVIDTDNNATDFIFVDTNGTSAGAGQRLGAPGPENLSSPRVNNAAYQVSTLDPCAAPSAAPNQVRDLTSDPANNSTFGTIDLRRTIFNNSDSPATRLRFRVTQQTTFPAPSGTADLRLRTSSDVVVTVDRAPCGSDTSNVTVNGTTLEQPPSQPNGSAFNGTVSANAVGPGAPAKPNGALGAIPKGLSGTPLNPGTGIDVRFLYGVQQTGKFRVVLNIEVLEATPIEEKAKDKESTTAAPVLTKRG